MQEKYCLNKSNKQIEHAFKLQILKRSNKINEVICYHLMFIALSFYIM